VRGYRRSPDPDTRVAFEAQADLMIARMAGAELALDARDVLDELRPGLAVVDCMLPAAIAAARAAGAPAVSLLDEVVEVGAVGRRIRSSSSSADWELM
jgi:hypothetical protein